MASKNSTLLGESTSNLSQASPFISPADAFKKKFIKVKDAEPEIDFNKKPVVLLRRLSERKICKYTQRKKYLKRKAEAALKVKNIAQKIKTSHLNKTKQNKTPEDTKIENSIDNVKKRQKKILVRENNVEKHLNLNENKQPKNKPDKIITSTEDTVDKEKQQPETFAVNLNVSDSVQSLKQEDLRKKQKKVREDINEKLLKISSNSAIDHSSKSSKTLKKQQLFEEKIRMHSNLGCSIHKMVIPRKSESDRLLEKKNMTVDGLLGGKENSVSDWIEARLKETRKKTDQNNSTTPVSPENTKNGMVKFIKKPPLQVSTDIFSFALGTLVANLQESAKNGVKFDIPPPKCDTDPDPLRNHRLKRRRNDDNRNVPNKRPREGDQRTPTHRTSGRHFDKLHNKIGEKQDMKKDYKQNLVTDHSKHRDRDKPNNPSHKQERKDHSRHSHREKRKSSKSPSTDSFHRRSHQENQASPTQSRSSSNSRHSSYEHSKVSLHESKSFSKEQLRMRRHDSPKHDERRHVFSNHRSPSKHKCDRSSPRKSRDSNGHRLNNHRSTRHNSSERSIKHGNINDISPRRGGGGNISLHANHLRSLALDRGNKRPELPRSYTNHEMSPLSVRDRSPNNDRIKHIKQDKSPSGSEHSQDTPTYRQSPVSRERPSKHRDKYHDRLDNDRPDNRRYKISPRSYDTKRFSPEEERSSTKYADEYKNTTFRKERYSSPERMDSRQRDPRRPHRDNNSRNTSKELPMDPEEWIRKRMGH